MGGRGSGRTFSYAGRNTTEDSMPLDIRRLAQAGVLAAGRVVSWEWTVNGVPKSSIRIKVESWRVTLEYIYKPRDKAAEVIDQTVRLETTPCTLGGQRPWFACPACDRRVAVIYGAGRLFACRSCKGLPYASQNEAADDRAARRADHIRKRLGWLPGFLNGPGMKPKGMHWRTYWRLQAEHDTLIALSMAGIGQRLGFLNRRLEE